MHDTPQPVPVAAPAALVAPIGLSRLRLADFRNYTALRLGFDRRFVVFYGANGAGKTNLLEAISLLSPGRGLRRATYQEIARQGGGGGFSVAASVVSDAGESTILTKVTPDAAGAATRSIRIDETAARNAEELLELLRVVWLTPSMDGLFNGPAGDRRRFLDRMVLAVDPSHGRRASDYERAMRSRNRLLSEERLDDSWLSGLEAQMAELGVAMAVARAELVDLLTGMIGESNAANPFPKAGLELASGYGDIDLARPAIEAEDEVRARLRNGRGLDRGAGRTLLGAHRAELSVTHVAKAMPAGLASTGEQKALLIGLVLGHAKLVTALSGMPPVLLLDEIAAHLDPGRRAALFDLIDDLGVQAFMTGTDAGLFDALADRAQMLEVDSGAIRPSGSSAAEA